MKKGLNTNLRENLAHYQQLGWARKALILLLSVAGAMLVGSLLILAVNADPLEAYYYMLIRPLTSLTSIGEVAMYFTPLLLVGLGVGLVHAPLSVMALEVTPEAKHGRVASWLQVADSAGPALELALVSVAMSAWAATATVGGAAYAPYWVIAAALAILTVFAVTRLRPASERSTGAEG